MLCFYRDSTMIIVNSATTSWLGQADPYFVKSIKETIDLGWTQLTSTNRWTFKNLKFVRAKSKNGEIKTRKANNQLCKTRCKLDKQKYTSVCKWDRKSGAKSYRVEKTCGRVYNEWWMINWFECIPEWFNL